MNATRLRSAWRDPPAASNRRTGRRSPQTADELVSADGQAPATCPPPYRGADSRRWYPVIDFSRCTNCMECIDFCLFGVYGVDKADTILVEQPDNCRKGCPACSRVCPENAIIFPQHKTPGIAGGPVEAGGIKLDLSSLFGAPTDSAAAVAAFRERDEQLMLAGQKPVGNAQTAHAGSAARSDSDAPADSEPRTSWTR